MKSKALLGVAAAGLVSWSVAFAAPDGMTSYDAIQPMPSMELLNSHLYTLDRFTHGVHSYGPLPNPETPYASPEVGKNDFVQDMRDRKDHLADVNAAREQVWIANAQVREDFRLAQAERQSVIDRTSTPTAIGRTSVRAAGGSISGGSR